MDAGGGGREGGGRGGARRADLGRQEEGELVRLGVEADGGALGEDLGEGAVAGRGGDAAADQREETSVGDAEAALGVEALRRPAGGGGGGQLGEELGLVLGEGAADLVRHHAAGSADAEAVADREDLGAGLAQRCEQLVRASQVELLEVGGGAVAARGPDPNRNTRNNPRRH